MQINHCYKCQRRRAISMPQHAKVTSRPSSRWRNAGYRGKKSLSLEATMEIEGSCHCGAIAYEAVVDPKAAALCHCTDCQTLSGSPLRASVPAKAGNFRILRGQPQIYVKTADSGAKRSQAFCADCGTPIYSAPSDNPTQYNLRLGAIKQRTQITPRTQAWCSSALSWAQHVEGLPRSPDD
jgi:hypothetical protein